MAGKPSTLPAIRIRSATIDDRGFAMSLVPRLVASTPVQRRNPRKLFAAYVEVIESALAAMKSHAALLIAERADLRPLGLALLAAASDCYTHRRQGHLAQIAVAQGVERSKERTALVEALILAACSRGYVVLTSDGFRKSHPATALCRWTGSGAEIREIRKDPSEESTR